MSGNPCTKWSTLTINEMEQVYTSIDLTKILDEEYDTRKTRIDHLHMGQLKRECAKQGIQNSNWMQKRSAGIEIASCNRRTYTCNVFFFVVPFGNAIENYLKYFFNMDCIQKVLNEARGEGSPEDYITRIALDQVSVNILLWLNLDFFFFDIF